MIESLVRAVAATFLLLMAMALLVYAGIIILITRNKIAEYAHNSDTEDNNE